MCYPIARLQSLWGGDHLYSEFAQHTGGFVAGLLRQL